MPTRPNLLIIQTDQQSAWTLDVYGGTAVKTPNASRLAAEGVMLEQCITPHALCTPSRGVFLTGRYPRCHGAWHNNIPLNRDERTFALQLADAGYDTGYAGKWHLDGAPKPGWVHPERGMGFTDCQYMYNRGHWKKIEDWPGVGQPTCFPDGSIGDERSYTSDWLTQKTIDFIDQQQANNPDRPFAYMMAIPDPHGPYEVREPYASLFKPEDMAAPETFDQHDLPDWAARDQRYALDNKNREAHLQHDIAQYFGMVKHIDDCLGRLLSHLEHRGILDHTILVFTSDHGEYLGEHGLSGKNKIYESAYRVPMLVRWPEKIPAGLRVRQHISLLDFSPTILGLMGVEASGREQGRDASALLCGQQTSWDDIAFIVAERPRRLGAFTQRFELAHIDGGQSVLFDRQNDPLQINNLADAPEHAATVSELTQRVREHVASFIETPMDIDWLPEYCQTRTT